MPDIDPIFCDPMFLPSPVLTAMLELLNKRYFTPHPAVEHIISASNTQHPDGPRWQRRARKKGH